MRNDLSYPPCTEYPTWKASSFVLYLFLSQEVSVPALLSLAGHRRRIRHSKVRPHFSHLKNPAVAAGSSNK